MPEGMRTPLSTVANAGEPQIVTRATARVTNRTRAHPRALRRVLVGRKARAAHTPPSALLLT
jgi:hypothetical protein